MCAPLWRNLHTRLRLQRRRSSSRQCSRRGSIRKRSSKHLQSQTRGHGRGRPTRRYDGEYDYEHKKLPVIDESKRPSSSCLMLSHKGVKGGREARVAEKELARVTVDCAGTGAPRSVQSAMQSKNVRQLQTLISVGSYLRLGRGEAAAFYQIIF